MENISSSWHIAFLKCQGHLKSTFYLLGFCQDQGHIQCWGVTFSDLSPTPAPSRSNASPCMVLSVWFFCQDWGRNLWLSWASWTQNLSSLCPSQGLPHPQMLSWGVYVPFVSKTYCVHFSVAQRAGIHGQAISSLSTVSWDPQWQDTK